MIINGNAVHLPLAGNSVQCVVTSPPYWGLRDYGTDGQIGLEPTPEEYVANMVAVFREVRRVLRDDGTVWLNIGDSYASGKGTCYNPGGGETSLGQERKAAGAHPLDRGNKSTLAAVGLKPKDLVGIPWRVAFALQADGWWLRSDIIWAKPNPMPESVKDRCTRSHEYVFMLTKSARYYYDNEAVKEPCASGPSDIRKMEEQQDRIGGKHKTLDDPLAAASAATQIGRKRAVPASWHGNGFDSERHIEKHPDTSRLPRWPGIGPKHAAIRDGNEGCRDMKAGWYRNRRDVWTVATEPYKGAHFATMPTRLIEPCILASSRPGDVVLDPFAGAGTVGLVASRLGRRHIVV